MNISGVASANRYSKNQARNLSRRVMTEKLHELIHRLSELDKKMRECYAEMREIGKIVDEMAKDDT